MHQELKITDLISLISDDQTIGFPAGMFEWPEKFGMWWYRKFYDRSHPFSRWLTQNRDQFEAKASVMYDTLLRVIILGWDEDKIRSTVNTILVRLKVSENNYFGIYDDLFLLEADFVK